MVHFEEDKNGFSTYTIKVEGEQESYLALIRSLLTLIRHAPEDMALKNEFYDVCMLIDNMLPDASQIVNMEDAELLKSLKAKKR